MDEEYSIKIVEELNQLNDLVDTCNGSEFIENERTDALEDLINELNLATTGEKQLFDR